MSHTSGEIARLLAENKDLIREKVVVCFPLYLRVYMGFARRRRLYGIEKSYQFSKRSTDGPRLKFSSTMRLVKSDCTTTCTGVVTLPQILNELRVALSNCLQELEEVSPVLCHKQVINDTTTVKKSSGF